MTRWLGRLFLVGRGPGGELVEPPVPGSSLSARPLDAAGVGALTPTLSPPPPAAFAKRSLHAAVDATSPMTADWTPARRAWEKWTGKHVGSSGMPIKAALLLNYDPTGPSRLFPMVAEQEGAKFTAVDLQPSIDFFRRNNLQTEFFSIGPNQYVVTSIHEHWFSARCVNTTQPGGEGVIIMQIGAYLLVSMYDGSVGSASRAMVAVDQFVWHFNRRTH